MGGNGRTERSLALSNEINSVSGESASHYSFLLRGDDFVITIQHQLDHLATTCLSSLAPKFPRCLVTDKTPSARAVQFASTPRRGRSPPPTCLMLVIPA